MPDERAQLYFIGAMMVLILILCGSAVYIFIRQYKKEMREKAERLKGAAVEKSERAGDLR